MTKGRPRTVRGAEKRGWPIVRVLRREDMSWMGIQNRVVRMTRGFALYRYDYQGGGWIAFENPSDAVLVQMKFGTLDDKKRPLPKNKPTWHDQGIG